MSDVRVQALKLNRSNNLSNEAPVDYLHFEYVIDDTGHCTLSSSTRPEEHFHATIVSLEGLAVNVVSAAPRKQRSSPVRTSRPDICLSLVAVRHGRISPGSELCDPRLGLRRHLPFRSEDVQQHHQYARRVGYRADDVRPQAHPYTIGPWTRRRARARSFSAGSSAPRPSWPRPGAGVRAAPARHPRRPRCLRGRAVLPRGGRARSTSAPSSLLPSSLLALPRHADLRVSVSSRPCVRAVSTHERSPAGRL